MSDWWSTAALWCQWHVQGCTVVFNNSNTHAHIQVHSDPLKHMFNIRWLMWLAETVQTLVQPYVNEDDLIKPQRCEKCLGCIWKVSHATMCSPGKEMNNTCREFLWSQSQTSFFFISFHKQHRCVDKDLHSFYRTQRKKQRKTPTHILYTHTFLQMQVVNANPTWG